MPGAFQGNIASTLNRKKHVKIGERKTKGSERQRPGRDGWPIAVDLVQKAPQTGCKSKTVSSQLTNSKPFAMY